MAPHECQHEEILAETRVHDLSVPFLEAQERRRAKKSSAKENGSEEILSTVFPAPLVLPGDDLSWDPKYPPQSLASWLRYPARNPVTERRRTMYIATVQDADFMSGWKEPCLMEKTSSKSKAPANEERFTSGLRDSDVNDVVDYLQAFYHGMPVKRAQVPLQFSTWSEESKPSKRKGQLMKASSPIGLNTDSECIRIRTRPSLDGVFEHQLNLEDLLDVCISILPSDAYALLLLVDQDMYEDDDDDFCCGRAAGGSRVAVVSTARYNPLLDAKQGVTRSHAWPASHCKNYIDQMIHEAQLDGPNSGKSTSKKRKRAAAAPEPTSRSPLRAAVRASAPLALRAHASSAASLRALFVARVSRTASHELGHCLGIDHCVFRACVMQGSATICEDARQPPYLCAVDRAKVLRATGADAADRVEALLRFCERWEGVHGADMFVGFAAWLRGALAEGEGEGSEE